MLISTSCQEGSDEAGNGNDVVRDSRSSWLLMQACMLEMADDCCCQQDGDEPDDDNDESWITLTAGCLCKLCSGMLEMADRLPAVSRTVMSQTMTTTSPGSRSSWLLMQAVHAC